MKSKFMEEALKEAQKAYGKNEVPIGAVIVKDGEIIGRGHNLKESTKDPTMHAEIIAIRQACKTVNHWWLEDCDMYVTLEPCAMCSGAILNSRMRKVYIATDDNRMGTCGSSIDLTNVKGFNHCFEVEFGTLKEESQKLLEDFFKKLRIEK